MKIVKKDKLLEAEEEKLSPFELKFRPVFRKVVDILDQSTHETWAEENWKHQVDLFATAGPPLRLLHWETVRDLGRIPRSSENKTHVAEAAEIAVTWTSRSPLRKFRNSRA